MRDTAREPPVRGYGEDLTPRSVSPVSEFVGIDPRVWLFGTVTRVVKSGAIVEVESPDSNARAEGLVHISQLSDSYVERAADYARVGQMVQVRVILVEEDANAMRLSMRPPNLD